MFRSKRLNKTSPETSFIMNMRYFHQFQSRLTATAMCGILTCVSALGKKIEVVDGNSGTPLQVEVMDIVDGKITMKVASGKVLTVSLGTLTPESASKAQSDLKSRMEEAQKMNELIGHPLFDGKGSLWQQPASKIARRMRWAAESRAKSSQSYRSYTRKDYAFIGAHPYCATLYGDPDGNAGLFSLVYANKGDFGSKVGMGEDHFKKIHPDEKPPISLNEAIELDAKVLTKNLSEHLGEPIKQFYGEKEDRRRVLRWNWQDHSFVLSQLDDEYVSLLIVPSEVADAEGKVKRITDSKMKELIAQNVQRKENGDVLIANIPMVNQGPKGYCVPATAERAMRYMAVPADMYLLAVAATNPEGGTNSRALMESCKRIVRSKARKIRELSLDKDLKIKDVQKYIDKGVPVLWQMHSLKGYNQIANKRTVERKSATDLEAWAETISAEAESVAKSLSRGEDNRHICMIIGYNEATNEFAVSDSWGIRYELRWVHADIVAAVTSGGGFVIDF